MGVNFSDFKVKDVINVCDGRKLGRPIDIIFNERACVEAIVVPSQCNFFSVFKPDREGYVIPWGRIRRIGDDVILVELDEEFPGCAR